ncbi:S1 family peptidase [Thiobacter aerophilum]|uniref:Serine protease n=1 Tax=Thiobacter aerophilum TaxID=3121275 RepID=A0ABV0EGV2_9BURK
MRGLLVYALLGFAAFVPAKADLVDTVARVKPAVVAVGSFQPMRSPQYVFQGTGFVVGQGLSVVTNAHVAPKTLDTVRQERLIVLAEVEGRPQVRGARIARVDWEHDLLLLAIDGPPLPALELGDATRVREGMDVAFTGFPLGMALGLRPVTHRGIVSAITPVATRMANARDLSPQAIERLKKPFFVFQLDATAYPGNSGSPLYDPHTGEVLGVLNSAFIKQSKEAAIKEPSGISYVIPATFVRALMEQERP